MLADKFKNHIQEVLSSQTSVTISITRISSVSGGSINTCVRLETNKGDYFLKYNSADRFPGMFECERRGLDLLSQSNTVSTPAQIASGVFENTSWLLLHFIHPGKRKAGYYENLGKALASLHRITSDSFGLDHDNYIGSLPQSNRQSANGIDFTIDQRLRPLVIMARGLNLLTSAEEKQFEALYKKLPDVLPGERPSLLHGDLWIGNVITGEDGEALLIDPAVYYGYRETDLAMSMLFGGFYSAFYDAYNEAFPLQAGWEHRVRLFQLYPLLVHLNLFGSGYHNSVIAALKTFL